MTGSERLFSFYDFVVFSRTIVVMVECLMIEIDGNQDGEGEGGARYDVCSFETTSHADFQYDDVVSLRVLEYLENDEGEDFQSLIARFVCFGSDSVEEGDGDG